MNPVNHVNDAAFLASGVAGTAVPALGAGAVLQTLFALVVVIALVFGCAWFARRIGWQSASRGGALKVVTSVAVGGKERATIVEVGGTWLVLGVAPGNVRLLHTLPAGAALGGMSDDTVTNAAKDLATDMASNAAAPPAGSFGQRFREALAGEARKRLMRTRS